MRTLTLLAVLVLLTACADPDALGTDPEPAGTAEEGTGTQTADPAPTDLVDPAPATDADIAICDDLADAGGLDLPPTTPPEPGVIPTPAVQAAHDQIESLAAWAQTEHPDTYGGMWIDGEALVVAFTADADERRPEVEARFTDAPVHVVEVPLSEADLYAVHAQVADVLPAQDRTAEMWVGAVGIRTNLNRVSVDVVGDAEAVRADLAGLAPVDALCLDVTPIPGEADAVPSPWSIPPGQEPSPDTTELEVWVHESACASGQPATDRVVVLDVAATDETVTVTLGVIPVAGGATCPSNPPTPFTVDLGDPLGDRSLVDGSTGQAPADPEGVPGD